jgi:hypothetical protein
MPTYLKLGHVLKAPEVFALIVCQNKEDIWLLGRDGEAAKHEDSQDEVHSRG